MLCYVMVLCYVTCYVVLYYVTLCYVSRFQSEPLLMAARVVAEDSVCLEYDAAKMGTRNLTFRGNAGSYSKIITQPTLRVYEPGVHKLICKIQRKIV
jgi:hypothetical protein